VTLPAFIIVVESVQEYIVLVTAPRRDVAFLQRWITRRPWSITCLTAYRILPHIIAINSHFNGIESI
jgi:hypothetical protein